MNVLIANSLLHSSHIVSAASVIVMQNNYVYKERLIVNNRNIISSSIDMLKYKKICCFLLFVEL